MALKPKIYKFRITLPDIDRNYYDTLNLTLAQHPSETLERMVQRTMNLSITITDNSAYVAAESGNVKCPGCHYKFHD